MSNSSKILVTGGTGYIGSHAVVELMGAGYEPYIIDNFCNSRPDVIDRIAAITGRSPGFARLDVRDRSGLRTLLSSHPFSAVLHFAGLKAVGESVSRPVAYYENNVTGTLCLLESMQEAGVRHLVFSSSATVYGNPMSVPITEDFPLEATNPYGRSKLMIEQILRDLAQADPSWHVAILRYFNPAGAHASGLIGEQPQGIPNNLMPYIAQVAAGLRPHLSVFGADYPTPDGTGVRDYIHVVDLALGHIAALRALPQHATLTVNLGTGRGYSVLEMVRAFSRASGREVPYRIEARRPGDVAECYADPARALRQLQWKAQQGIEAMCADAWHWQTSSAICQAERPGATC